MFRRKGYKIIAILSTISLFFGISSITTFAAPEVVVSSTTDITETVQVEDNTQTAQEEDAEQDVQNGNAEQTAQDAESFPAEESSNVVETEAEVEEETEQAPETLEDEVLEASSDQQDQTEIVEEIEDKEEKEVKFGFSVSVYSLSDMFKCESCSSRNTDGTNTFEICFLCDGEESWINENIRFEIKDVTPNGIISVMKDAGIEYSEPVSSVTSADSYLKSDYLNEGLLTITEPFGEDRSVMDGSPVAASSGKVITVNAGMSTRYLKITAFLGGEAVDDIYLISNGRMSDNTTYSAQDQELFENACIAVEAMLWEKGMSNLEKLQAFADYIGSVSHYPGSDTTKVEYNPDWANRWGVDGSTDYNLIWHNFEDKYVDWTMALEGGQSNSCAVDILYYVAQNHLGLKSISDGDTAVGEGVYIASGSKSSDPTNEGHYSLIYQAEDGSRTFVDAQGLSYSAASDHVTCSSHGCQSVIIPISSYSASEAGSKDDTDDTFIWDEAEEEIDFQVSPVDDTEDSYVDTSEDGTSFQADIADKTDTYYWDDTEDEMDFVFETVDDASAFFWDVAADDVDFMVDTIDDTGISYWDGEEEIDFMTDTFDDDTFISDDVEVWDDLYEESEDDNATDLDIDNDKDKGIVGFLKNFPMTGEDWTFLPYLIVVLSASGAIAVLFIHRRRRNAHF